MQNITRNLILSVLLSTVLSGAALAQNARPAEDNAESSATVITETMQEQEQPVPTELPLITQEDISEAKPAESPRQTPHRPHGYSRSDEVKASRAMEKPLLEVHGF